MGILVEPGWEKTERYVNTPKHPLSSGNQHPIYITGQPSSDFPWPDSLTLSLAGDIPAVSFRLTAKKLEHDYKH